MDLDDDAVAQMMASLKKTAAKYGCDMGTRTRTYNSRLAQELGLWAETRGRGHEFHMTAFRAYFVDGRNLARREVLIDLASSAGLDPDEAGTVIDSRSFSNAVDRDWNRSRELGITAVPTYLSGFSRLVGAQSYEALAGLVSSPASPKGRLL